MTQAVKFADLVRETTTTSGTSNLVLKGPPAGYRAFADVLAPGDTFYYSILNQSRPEETETGIGTLELDGTISRAPSDGAFTDFSNGAKQVALVVGAPWFAAVGGGNGNSGGGGGGGDPSTTTQMIRVTDFGALPDVDTSAASDANKAAFAAAAAEACTSGKSLLLPAGTYWIDAASGSGSGVRLAASDGTTLRVVGEPGAIIKRRAAPTMAPTSALVFLIANAGTTYQFENVALDGNEAECAYDVADAYAHEQSANIKWLSGTGTPHAIRFHDCDVGRNRVGDGYHQNVGVDHFIATHCSTTDRTVRRVRADWQFSRYATFGTVMANCECNSWESEPHATPATGRLLLSNMLVHSVFDLAGDSSGSEINPVRAQLANVTCLATAGRAGLPFVNFYRVHGTATNCHFHDVRRFQRCKLTMIGGSLTVKDAGSGVASPVQVWHDQMSEADNYAAYRDRFGNFLTLDAVELRAVDSVTTGAFLKFGSTATLAGKRGPTMVRTTLRDCQVPRPLDQVILVSRAGDVEISGGQLVANGAIAQFSNDGGFYTRLMMRAQPCWDAPALIAPSGTIDVAGSRIELSGELASDRPGGGIMQVVSSGHVYSTSSIRWDVTMQLLVGAPPAGTHKSVPGLIAKVKSPGLGMPIRYVASYPAFATATNYGGTAWDILDQPLVEGQESVASITVPAAASVALTTSLAVRDVAPGDFVIGLSHSSPIQGLMLQGAVNAAGNVTVHLHNPGSSAVTVNGGTVRACVRKAA